MTIWFSNTAKKMCRANTNYYTTSGSSYVGYCYNGEPLKAIDGNEYLSFTYDSVNLATASPASNYAYAVPAKNFQQILSSAYTGTNLHACIDNDFDDSKYAITNEVSGITFTISRAFPGATVVVASNSSSVAKTFSSIVAITPAIRSSTVKLPLQDTANWTTKQYLAYAFIFDEPVTLAPSETYTITLTT